MPVRVVQWTTGNVGKQSVKAIAAVAASPPGIPTYPDISPRPRGWVRTV